MQDILFKRELIKEGGDLMRKKKTIQLKAIVSRETWLKLRRMVEAGKIRGMLDGVTRAVEEFVKKSEATNETNKK